MAASKQAAQRDLTRSAAIALGLCCALGLAAWALELRPAIVLADERVAIEPGTVHLGESFDVDGPTVLRVELSRDEHEGFVGAAIDLVDDATAAAYSVHLGTDVRDAIHRDHADTRVQRVETGRYYVRVTPRRTGESAPRECRVRVLEGDRSPYLFFFALALLLAPLGVAILRYFNAVRLPVREPWTSAPS